MKLKKLTTRNYKNLYAEESFPIKDLNIFIGPNGSGKSNIINILKFLKDSITPVDEAKGGVTSFDASIANLGSSKILDVSIARPANVRFAFEFDPEKEGLENQIFDLEVLIQDAHKKVIIHEESLYNSSEPPFYFYRCHNPKSGNGVVSVYTGQRHQTRLASLPDVPVDDLSLFKITQLLENTEFPPEKTPIYKVRREFIQFISEWRFYNANNMNLSSIRLTEPKIGQGDKFLSPSGENLSLVLYNLMKESLDFEEHINNAMKAILPFTRKVRAIPSGVLSLTVEWHMENIKEPFYLHEMSDGTVRMLCWATILHSPILPPFLIIDEPEIGIHVAWLQVLSEWIKDAAERTQIIICTHSPDLLDYFTDRVEDVLVFEPKGKDKIHSEVKTLSQPKVDAWIQEGWKLGDLYSVGDPSVGGWPW